MAAKKKTQKKAPQKTSKPQAKKHAGRSQPAAVRAPKAPKALDEDAPEKPETEKKVYSKEEQEILRRKRFTLDDDDEGEVLEVKVKKKGILPAEEELAGEPRSYDTDEYFYEETSEDRYA